MARARRAWARRTAWKAPTRRRRAASLRSSRIVFVVSVAFVVFVVNWLFSPLLPRLLVGLAAPARVGARLSAYMFICLLMCVYIYIYIYIEREIYIYIYI